MTEATPGDVLELDYTVDALLQIDAIEESIGGGSPESYDYGYDPALRLTNATYPASTALPAENWTYDPRGNRQDASGNLFAYDADNRITESSGGNPKRCFGHDADGNLVTIGNEGSSGCSDSVPVRTLVWDKVNRLTSVSETGVLGSYVYDPFGRRIAKTASSTTTKFLWDGVRLLAEYQGTTRTRRYEYAGGFAPARVQMGSAGVMEVHTDHLDTPRMLTDSTKATFWQASYEAYGRAQIDVDPGSTMAFNIRFPGQYFDAETGMHYNRFRYYSPETGRYVSADPIGQIGGSNLFNYTRNLPTGGVDPRGLYLIAGSPDRIQGDFGMAAHYFIGFGRPINLASSGLGEKYENTPDVRAAVQAFDQAVASAAAKAAEEGCKSCPYDERKSGDFYVPSDQFPTQSQHQEDLFSLGNGELSASASECVYTVNCETGDFAYSCATDFAVNDVFTDPLDFGEKFGHPVDFGFKFDINYRFRGSSVGAGGPSR